MSAPKRAPKVAPTPLLKSSFLHSLLILPLTVFVRQEQLDELELELELELVEAAANTMRLMIEADIGAELADDDAVLDAFEVTRGLCLATPWGPVAALPSLAAGARQC